MEMTCSLERKHLYEGITMGFADVQRFVIIKGRNLVFKACHVHVYVFHAVKSVEFSGLR